MLLKNFALSFANTLSGFNDMADDGIPLLVNSPTDKFCKFCNSDNLIISLIDIFAITVEALAELHPLSQYPVHVPLQATQLPVHDVQPLQPLQPPHVLPHPPVQPLQPPHPPEHPLHPLHEVSHPPEHPPEHPAEQLEHELAPPLQELEQLQCDDDDVPLHPTQLQLNFNHPLISFNKLLYSVSPIISIAVSLFRLQSYRLSKLNFLYSLFQ